MIVTHLSHNVVLAYEQLEWAVTTSVGAYGNNNHR